MATRQFPAAAASLLLMGFWASGADAACTRQIINRSAYVLVGTQNGGPAFTVRPGTSKSVRLSEPGRFDLAAYCPSRGLTAPAASVADAEFSYNAVLDRCYVEIGHDFFDNELGRGFLPRLGDRPFTVNNPKQGDIVLGPFAAACPPAR